MYFEFSLIKEKWTAPLLNLLPINLFKKTCLNWKLLLSTGFLWLDGHKTNTNQSYKTQSQALLPDVNADNSSKLQSNGSENVGTQKISWAAVLFNQSYLTFGVWSYLAL